MFLIDPPPPIHEPLFHIMLQCIINDHTHYTPNVQSLLSYITIYEIQSIQCNDIINKLASSVMARPSLGLGLLGPDIYTKAEKNKGIISISTLGEMISQNN